MTEAMMGPNSPRIFTLKEPLSGLLPGSGSESPEPSGSLHGDEMNKDLSDSHACETADPGFIGGSTDGPFYSLHAQGPHREYSPDISLDKYPIHGEFGVPPNPHCTPACNSERSASPEPRWCHAWESPISASKATNLSFSCLDGIQGMHDGCPDNGDANARRKRVLLTPFRVDPAFGVLSPTFGSLDDPTDGLHDTTPPRLRSPQFSPPSSFFGPPRIHFRRQDSMGALPSTEQRTMSAKKARYRRRRLFQRPFPYRIPTRTLPAEHTRFPTPFPSIRSLPFRRGNHVYRELSGPVHRRSYIQNAKELLGCPVRQWLREYAMIRLSLHKSLPSSDPCSTSYLFYLRISQSTFSAKFSHTTRPDRRAMSPVLSAPGDGATMVLFQVSFFVPLVALSVVQICVSGVRGVLGSNPIRAPVSAVVGALVAVVSVPALLVLRVLRLVGRIRRQVAR
ncbi:hypothetical protein PHISP_04259 [Aspergillus sp. HF37]|nr:hypothetical protein PHISP_04259 [Aspergillus sp. HF37]